MLSLSIVSAKYGGICGPFYVVRLSLLAEPMMMALSHDGRVWESGVMLSTNTGLTSTAKFGSSRLGFQLHHATGETPQISPEKQGHLLGQSMPPYS